MSHKIEHIMRPFAVAACLILVWSAAACESGRDASRARLTSSDVRSAFSASGIPIRESGAALGIDNYVDARSFRFYTSKEQWLQIEIFETPKTAAAAWAAGGNLADPYDGVIVKPFALIRNVIITRFPGATSTQRARLVNAVRLLRNEQGK